MSLELKKHSNFAGVDGPVFVVVLDGVGIAPKDIGNAVHLAHTPVLDQLFTSSPNISLAAHGTAVGMASDADMGNSEVGHNAIGAGRVFDQGAKLVEQSIKEGALFRGDIWNQAIKNTQDHNSALHFIGLLSDGNVHSNIDHLKSMIRKANTEGIKKVFVHVLLDGRDVPDGSSIDYVLDLENTLNSYNEKDNCIYKIASGGGRMITTMDRYEADWNIVKRGWQAHVLGDAPKFPNAIAAIESARAEDSSISDQNLPPFVIAEDGKAIGTIEDGDSVIFFNFRGDRGIEISQAFENEEFDKFDRIRHPKVFYAGMMQYDGDLKLPSRYLVDPPCISETMGEYFAHNNVNQLAISETQKYGHVTFFWNGNRSGYFDEKKEDYCEIPSDVIPSFADKPWMKAAEITAKTIQELRTGKHQFGRLNLANGDMVGHTGDLDATMLAMSVTDMALGKFLKAVDDLNGVALITADHGNADEMFEKDKKGKFIIDEFNKYKPKTSHTLNPVPFIVHDGSKKLNVEFDTTIQKPGLSNIAATCFNLMGFQAPAEYDQGLLNL